MATTKLTNENFGIRNEGPRFAVLKALLPGKPVTHATLAKAAKKADVAGTVRYIEHKASINKLSMRVLRDENKSGEKVYTMTRGAVRGTTSAKKPAKKTAKKSKTA